MLYIHINIILKSIKMSTEEKINEVIDKLDDDEIETLKEAIKNNKNNSKIKSLVLYEQEYKIIKDVYLQTKKLLRSYLENKINNNELITILNYINDECYDMLYQSIRKLGIYGMPMGKECLLSLEILKNKYNLKDGIIYYGAGTGFLAKYLNNYYIENNIVTNIEAYDIAKGIDNMDINYNIEYYNIELSNKIKWDSTDNYALLLSWIPDNSLMGINAIKKFRGNVIILIGQIIDEFNKNDPVSIFFKYLFENYNIFYKNYTEVQLYPDNSDNKIDEYVYIFIKKE